MNNSFYIQWHITNKCNCRCIHCYQDTYSETEELDSGELLKICQNLEYTMKRWNKKLVISLTGGEPFLKKELYQILRYLNNSEYVSEFNIITNATILNKEVLSIKKRFNKFDTMFVSLEGTTQQTNDNIRGKGMFEKINNNLKIFKENGYKIVIMFTLLESNYNEAINLDEFVKEINADGFIIERFMPLGQAKKIKEKEFVNGERIEKLYKEIFKKFDIEFEEMDATVYRSLRCINSELGGSFCTAGRDGMCIMPSGTVFPCRRFCVPFGNLLKEPLIEIWSNAKILSEIQNKKNFIGKCKDCKISDCYGCRAMAFAITENYLSEDIQCRMSNP